MAAYVWVLLILAALYGLLAAGVDLLEWVRLRLAKKEQLRSVSVVVIAKNREDIIEGFIRTVCSFAISCNTVGYEVIVIDDHSSDQTGAIIQRLAAASQVLRAVRMKDIAHLNQSPEQVGTLLARSDIVLLCRLTGDLDHIATLNTIKCMLRRSRGDRDRIHLYMGAKG